jgi:hypothetical protein
MVLLVLVVPISFSTSQILKLLWFHLCHKSQTCKTQTAATKELIFLLELIIFTLNNDCPILLIDAYANGILFF